MSKRARIDQGTILVQAPEEPVAEPAVYARMITAANTICRFQDHRQLADDSEVDDEVEQSKLQPAAAKRAKTGEQTM